MTWQLAQVNIALPAEPLDSARLADFVAALEPINALADDAPGFVWRLQGDGGDATDVRAFGDDRIVVNMSVWSGPEELARFAFRSDHVDVMRRRREWFVPLREAYAVLWWVPAGHRPTVAEAEERLALLRTEGPGPRAFTLRAPFPPPDAAPGDASSGAVTSTPDATSDAENDWFCPA